MLFYLAKLAVVLQACQIQMLAFLHIRVDLYTMQEKKWTRKFICVYTKQSPKFLIKLFQTGLQLTMKCIAYYIIHRCTNIDGTDARTQTQWHIYTCMQHIYAHIRTHTPHTYSSLIHTVIQCSLFNYYKENILFLLNIPVIRIFWIKNILT